MGVFQKFDEQRVPTVPIFTYGFESGDISAWGTGLGTSPNRSDRNVSPVENFAETNNVEVHVGGVPAERIFYAGPNPNFPALDQYNILPSPGTPPGCFVPLDIVVNDCPPSSFVGIPVSPEGGACFDPLNPYLEDSGAWPRDILDVQLVQAHVTIPTADGERTDVRVEQARAEAGQYNFTNLNVGVHYPSLGTCAAFNGAGLDQDDVFRRAPPVALKTGEFRLTRLGVSDTVTFDKDDPGVDMWSQQLFDPEADPSSCLMTLTPSSTQAAKRRTSPRSISVSQLGSDSGGGASPERAWRRGRWPSFSVSGLGEPGELRPQDGDWPRPDPRVGWGRSRPGANGHHD